MSSYNYSYNVLINRLEVFAAGHFMIRRFTHGQIDLADQLQDDQYPFMHVVPEQIRPVDGGMQFDFLIMFADIPRDKEYKAEYQREVISDCVRLGQDLVAEVKNGLQLFGFDVQLTNNPTFEPFMEEQKNTVTGVTFTLSLEVPWDWSACDIPAIWTTQGASSGGTANPYGITLRTNGVNNQVQNILDLVAGSNITITDNGDGSVTFDAQGDNIAHYVSTEWNANHTTAAGNPYVIGDRVWYNGGIYQCIANNDAINPSNPSYWTLLSVGYRLRQNPVDWNATSGDYQILNKPTIPVLPGNIVEDVTASAPILSSGGTTPDISIPAANLFQDGYLTSADFTAFYNKFDVPTGAGSDYLDGTGTPVPFPSIPPAQVNSDWNAVSGLAQILNKPSLATVATSGDYNDLSNLPTIPAAQIQSDWNQSNVSALDYIKNKPTIPGAQGLQDVITQNPVLTTNNNITFGANNLVFQGAQGNIINSLSFYPGSADFGAATVIPSPYSNITSRVYFDGLRGYFEASDFNTQNYVAIRVDAGNNQLQIVTPNVQLSNATNGQVLTLVNQTTGAVEFQTPVTGGGTVKSVGLTMPSAFSVTGSPVTIAGTFAVTGAGTNLQYMRGDGTLATFPTIPAAQVNSDWNAVSGLAQILNKPTIPAAQIQSDWNQANTSALDYIKNKPTVGAGSVISVGTAGLISGGTITTSGTITTAMNTNKLVGRYTAGSGVMEEITVGSGLTLTGAGVLNNTATPTPTGYYGAFQDTTSQTAAIINTAYAVKFNTTDLSNGVTIVNDGSSNPTRVTLANTGIYNIQFSLQMEKTGGSGNMIADIWIRKNGVDVPSTTGKMVLTGSANASPVVAAWNYVLDLVAGDYVQLMWATSNTNVEIVAASATTPHPSIPSSILTVTQQAGILAGTGITAINSLTGAAQTIGVGTSGTDFAVSSSGTAHTLNLPTASASNRGALSSADWSTFNGKQAALASGTTIKTVNSTSLLGSGDVAVQATLVSGTNIKTVNSTSLLGSGDVAVQATLVSGTNIKTINSTSLLGSGNIPIATTDSMVFASAPNSGHTNIGGTTGYWAITGSGAIRTTENAAVVIIPYAGTLKNFYVRMGASAASSGSIVMTVRKNGVDTALTLTFVQADGANITKSDTTNSVAVSAGDRITIGGTNNGTSQAGTVVSTILCLER